MKTTGKLILSLLIGFFLIPCLGMAEDNKLQDAPPFTLENLEGKELSLTDYEGKVVFLNFWATWCPPCREEIPGFIEVYERYKTQGMEIIGISVDKAPPEEVKEFAEEYEINYPVVMGTREVVNAYQPGRYIPTTIIIDTKGKIREKHVGYMDKQTLKKYFLKYKKN